MSDDPRWMAVDATGEAPASVAAASSTQVQGEQRSGEAIALATGESAAGKFKVGDLVWFAETSTSPPSCGPWVPAKVTHVDKDGRIALDRKRNIWVARHKDDIWTYHDPGDEENCRRLIFVEERWHSMGKKQRKGPHRV